MALPLFTFLTPAKSIPLPGELVSEGPHEHAKRAIDRLYRIPEGHVILTLWKGKVHCVIYQAPLEDETASESRNAGLFAHYGEGKVWNEILDNGFGKTYRREDMERFALWSYAMDYNTFGTMAFHEVMWG
jgi:hypothetical protein